MLAAACIPGAAAAKTAAPLPDFIFDAPPPGARAAGMGRAYTSVAEGPEAIFWNPAGLRDTMRKEPVSSKRQPGLRERLSRKGGAGAGKFIPGKFTCTINIDRAGTATRDEIIANDPLQAKRLLHIGFAGTFSFSWRALASYKYSSQAAALESTEFSMSQYALGFTMRTLSNITWGLAISYLNGRLAYSSNPSAGTTGTAQASVAHANGLCLDWGLLWLFPGKSQTMMGICLQNGPAVVWWDKYNSQRLKSVLRVGFSSIAAGVLTTTVEYERRFRPGTGRNQYKFGFEQRFSSQAWVRQGLSFEKLNNFVQNSRQSLGVGVEISSRYLIDFAMERYRIENAARNAVYNFTMSLSLRP